MSTRTHLVYRVSAALGSMGTLAGNERRGTDDWPARSAITGMLGAALGVRRNDRESLGRLETDYAVGLARVRLGPVLVDFHTAQTVPTSAAKRPSSRREALALGEAKGSVGTVITHREYHQGCSFDVALTAIVDEPRWSLETLSDALNRPYYVLYFGRKACPLDLPLGPRPVEAEDTVAAFEAYRVATDRDSSEVAEAFLLDPALAEEASASGRKIVRRDGVVDRERWTFTDRESVLLDASVETSS